MSLSKHDAPTFIHTVAKGNIHREQADSCGEGGWMRGAKKKKLRDATRTTVQWHGVAHGGG